MYLVTAQFVYLVSDALRVTKQIMIKSNKSDLFHLNQILLNLKRFVWSKADFCNINHDFIEKIKDRLL